MATSAYALDGVVQNNADATTGWSVAALDNELQIQGTGCIGQKTGAGVTRYNHLGTARDFTTGTFLGRHVVVWFNVLTFANLDTLAAGGVRVYVGNDAGTNFEEFSVTGLGSGYFGGWVAAIVDPNVSSGAGDFTGGTYSAAAADAFGITYNMTAGIMGNFTNAVVDQITIGTGIIQTAGDTGTVGNFDGYLTNDEGTNVYGFFSRVNNIVLSQGKFIIGDGTTTTVFTDSGETVVFLDRPVAVDFYEIFIDTDATCTFGTISGGSTSDGCSFDSAGAAKYTVTVIEGGTVEAVFNAYATTFKNYRQVDLNPSTTIQDCIFSGGDGVITPNGATFDGCTISSSLVGANIGAVLLDSQTEFDNSGSPIIQNTLFSNHNANASSGAIQITAAGTYSFIGLTFNNNSYDIINSSGGEVIIQVGAGSDTPTFLNVGGGSTTDVQNSVTLTLTGIQTDSNVLVVPVSSADTTGDFPFAETENTTSALTTVRVANAGSGYVVNDKLTLTGGTFSTAAILNVDSVDGGGAITGVSIDNAGASYSIDPINPVSHTGGTGTLATFNTEFTGIFSYSYNAVAGVIVDINIFNLDFEDVRFVNFELDTSSQSIPVQQQTDRNYLNP